MKIDRERDSQGMEYPTSELETLINAICAFAGESNEALKESLRRDLRSPIALLDILCITAETGGPGSEQLIADVEAHLVELSKEYALLDGEKTLTRDEQFIQRKFTSNEILKMWNYRKKNQVYGPIVNIYESMDALINEVSEEDGLSKKDAADLVEAECHGRYQHLENVGLIIYAK